MRNHKIKTSLEKDTTLNFPLWHKNGTQEAFLMHVTVVMDAIKKCGTFKDYEKAQKAYVEAKSSTWEFESGISFSPLSQRSCHYFKTATLTSL
jgi:hypothetical protein